MAAGDTTLNILINASAGNVSGVVGNVAKALSGLAAGSGPLGAIVGVGAAVAGTLVAVGAEAVKTAGNFEQMTNTLVTSAGESEKKLAMVRQGILDISVGTGTSTDQLVKAMYQIESSGRRGADGLNVLKVAAQGAKSENADLGTVAKAVTIVLTDYHMSSNQASQAMNGLIATVQNGQTSLQELSGAMGAVLPIASALHVKFPDVAGAIATLTNAGMPAQQAAQNLAHVLVALSAPSGIAVKSMQSVGLTAQQVKDALANQGLPAALQLIEDHVGKKFPVNSVEYQTALKNIMGGLVGFKLSAMLTGQSLKDFEANIKKISGAMADGKGEVLGWDVVQASFNFKVDQAKQALNALMIIIGTKLLPVIAPIIGGMTSIISSLTQMISGMNGAGTSSKTFQHIMELLGVTFAYLEGIVGSVGQVLGSIFAAGAKAAGSALADFAKNSLPGIIAGLNGILYNVREVVTLFADWFTSTNQAGKAVGGLGAILKDMGAFLSSTFAPVWKTLVDTFNSQVKPAWDDFVASIGPAMPALKFIAGVIGVLLVGALKMFVQQSADALKVGIMVFGALVRGVLQFATEIMNDLAMAAQAWDAIVSAWNAAPGFFTGIWNAVKKAFQTAWDSIASQAKMAWSKVTDAWGATGKWFQDVGATIQKAIGTAWTWIQTTSKSVWNEIVKIVTKPIDDIVGSFKWLYDHNYYFHDLVEAIKKAFHDGIAWIQTAWTDTGNWLTKQWQQVSRSASEQWGRVTGFISQQVTTATKFVQEQWGRLTGWLSQQWNNLATWAQQAWKTVAKAFSDAWGAISGALSTLWNNISKWWNTTQQQSKKAADSLWKQISSVFSNAWSTYISRPLSTLAGNIGNWFTTQFNNFKNWGANMLKMMGDGITSGFHFVITAITNLGQNIAKLLSFHSPPASGPLATSDQWMPNMMRMFGTGISTNLSFVTNAISQVAQKIADFFKHTSPAKAGPLAGDDQWMPSMTKMFANGIVAGIPGVTAATNRLALTVSTAFTKLNTNVTTSTNQINTQLQLLSTNTQTQAGNVSAQFTTLNTNVTTATGNINNNIQNLNTLSQTAFQQVGTNANKASIQVQNASGQISSSSQGAASNVQQAGSKIVTTFGQTTQASTQAVQQLSQAAEDAQTHWNYAKQELSQSLSRFSTGFADEAKGDGKHAGQAFADGFSQMGQAAYAAAQSLASQIQALLGHSRPKEGPLKDDDQWGKHFVENITSGIYSGMPALSAATNMVAGTLGGVNSSSRISPSGAGYASSGKPMVIYVQLDKKTIGKAVTHYQTTELRVQGGIRGI